MIRKSKRRPRKSPRRPRKSPRRPRKSPRRPRKSSRKSPRRPRKSKRRPRKSRGVEGVDFKTFFITKEPSSSCHKQMMEQKKIRSKKKMRYSLII